LGVLTGSLHASGQTDLAARNPPCTHSHTNSASDPRLAPTMSARVERAFCSSAAGNSILESAVPGTVDFVLVPPSRRRKGSVPVLVGPPFRWCAPRKRIHSKRLALLGDRAGAVPGRTPSTSEACVPISPCWRASARYSRPLADQTTTVTSRPNPEVAVGERACLFRSAARALSRALRNHKGTVKSCDQTCSVSNHQGAALLRF
jgi:hypothetical protein